ncbi:GH92 family glycosyl hydrolase [Flaviaesturariibacter amylovorans]|uniref:GH92 family glycosyl hydrolase n=1 Tax=Flaviaesturariibacter amylovorans TaxID=1084520 RepID=A0ABP8HHL4_9BACT
MSLKLLPVALLLSLGTSAQTTNHASFVNPLIGTHRMGHTYPGATVPFGMVQLSPDTDTIPYEVNGKYVPDVYKYCAGYQYSDRTIVGFSHTHFSGTGHSDLGDVLLMPTLGPLQLNPGTADDPASGFRSAYAHTDERAAPAYYRALLQDHDIDAELTASTRVGMHRYTFRKGGDAHVILDLVHGIYNHAQKNVWTFVRVENDSLITGFRQTAGWAKTRTQYFAIAFSKPFKSFGYNTGGDKETYRGFWGKFNTRQNFRELIARQLRAHFDFDARDGEQLLVKVALSPVSAQGALRNLRAEVPHWSFDRVKNEGQQQWNKVLGAVDVQTIEPADRINFYTALYHAYIGTTVYSDVDGRYRGLDQEVHTATGFTNYTTFSLWDTYRALHPLYTLLQPQRNADMVRSMLAHYRQSAHKMLPVWSHHANENWCMIGYHAVPVLVDAVLKGAPGIDPKAALEACVTTARNRQYEGLGPYMQYGYVPEDKSGSSVSKTLEYAYDDWCIAQLARKLGRTDIYNEFSKRAASYRNVWDASTGFMRPRMSDGSFLKEFDVLNTHQRGYIEGNAWNYSLYVPHAPEAMIGLLGGPELFTAHLDSLFTMELPDKYFEKTEDISRDGIIGNYVHGKEPSHHVPYLYNWTGAPWKTQERVRHILPRMYRPEPGGLGGNDDCGQMSAWYLFSALGFYPVTPGSGEYAIGSPLVQSATLRLGGKTLRIEAAHQSAQNVYVQSVTLNGKRLTRPFIRHADLVQGGTLRFVMGPVVNKEAFK